MGQCNFSGQRDRSYFIVKGTKEQAQNLAIGWDRQGQSVKIQGWTCDMTITIFLSKSRAGRVMGLNGTITISSSFRSSFPVYGRTFPVLEHPLLFRTSFPVQKHPILV